MWSCDRTACCATASASVASGFAWSGARISHAKRSGRTGGRRPMIERQPYLPRFVAGGDAIRSAPAHSISARRSLIHGTNQPQTIGHAVSSGGFRMVNEDVIDLQTNACRSAPRSSSNRAPVFEVGTWTGVSHYLRRKTWHGRDGVTLADERASQRGTRTSA